MFPTPNPSIVSDARWLNPDELTDKRGRSSQMDNPDERWRLTAKPGSTYARLMAREPSADIQQIAQLLQASMGGGRGRRSPLFRWMYSRADDLKRLLDDVQPSWDAVAAVLPSTSDVNDGSGKRPNGERVRKTWFEVRQAKGWDTSKNRAAANTVAKSQPRRPSAPPTNPAPERMAQAFQPPSLIDSHSHARPVEPVSRSRERKPMVLRPARTIGPTEVPEDDGSKLPKPLHRVR